MNNIKQYCLSGKQGNVKNHDGIYFNVIYSIQNKAEINKSVPFVVKDNKGK